MDHTSIKTNKALSAALTEIDAAILGETRTDALSRAIYATDASIYEIVPDGVILPRTINDVVTTVRLCRKHGIPLTARGAGTGLAGGAVNRGLQLDCSRYLDRILDINVENQTARVEPGVVLDELNGEIKQYGLHFAPDVATSSRATIGGMVANNSCGAHSVIYGRTVDHVLSLDLVLSDGSSVTWGKGATCENTFARHCEQILSEITLEYADEIAARYPKVLRRNGGYALDRLRLEDDRVNPETIICGSEGTLAIVVGATLKLTPIPKQRGLMVAHFADLLESLSATPVILQHNPAAVELVDNLIIGAAMEHPTMVQQRAPIDGEPQALLIIELFDEDQTNLDRRLQEIVEDLRSHGLGYAWPVLIDPEQQAQIWEIRKNGLGLLMSRPGDHQPYAFVEDTAVDPARLRDYIERFARILDEERVGQAGYYAHASVGCLHVRPVLNLKDCRDVERMRRIADRVSSLALEFGGTMTGEHGDGILRSCWLEKMYGPRIIEAFHKIKNAFDPNGIFNPGKIVSPLPMTRHLRYEAVPGVSFKEEARDTLLDFTENGGMLGLANMCSGVGQCRQRLVGTMCPSFMATNDEKHTTRARANALRMALSNQSLIRGFSDPVLAETMDLCLSCKACKSECPTGVDMARLKAEWQHHRHRANGAPLRSRLIAGVADMARFAGRFPSLSNVIAQSTWARATLERLFGIDRRVSPPLFARESFRRWFERHRRKIRNRKTGNGQVVYFVDTWTNYFAPQVGIALVKLLEALSYDVIVPATVCCGRPAISQGMLEDAKRLAEQNVAILTEVAGPIIVTEPSCFSVFVDELPQFLRTGKARQIAERTVMADSFIVDAMRSAPDALPFGTNSQPVLYHGHCHQKALLGTTDAMHILRTLTCGLATEINSGCCGMAGSFGHEIEHYEVARDVGEQRLFPAVRGRGDAEVVVSGFSCRHQIEHHTGVRTRHMIELVASRISETM